MSRILFLGNSALVLYRFRRELIQALLQNGDHVVLSAPEDEYYEALKALGAEIIVTEVNRHGMNPLAELKLFREYKKIIKSIKPDVILTYTIKPNIYGNLAARGLEIPVISTITGLGLAFGSNGLTGRLARILYRFAFLRVACVVFQNTENEEIMRMAKIITSQRTLLVPGSGVNLAQFTVLHEAKGPETSFLYVGRIMREKGVAVLLEVVRRLKKEGAAGFSVTLLGFHDGDLVREVDLEEKEGIVRYVGFQEDTVPFLQNAHCVVHPSFGEGISNSLLEAAASGRPLIATDISGCREIIDDGVNGYLCKPKDPDSLYDCMKRFLNLTVEHRSKMGAASRKKVEAEFNRDIVVKQMLGLIKEIARRSAE